MASIVLPKMGSSAKIVEIGTHTGVSPYTTKTATFDVATILPNDYGKLTSDNFYFRPGTNYIAQGSGGISPGDKTFDTTWSYDSESGTLKVSNVGDNKSHANCGIGFTVYAVY